MGKVALGYGGRPVHWIRYNPDAFKVGGVTRRTTAKEREAVLLKVLQAAYCAIAEDHLITIHYVCYDTAGPDLVQTLRFKTIEAYCVWVETAVPPRSPSG